MAHANLGLPPRFVDGRHESGPEGYPEVYELYVYVDRDSWPRGAAKIGLSAVIEETDGTKSYWALAHPDGPPDFHDPACFVLELPAAG